MDFVEVHEVRPAYEGPVSGGSGVGIGMDGFRVAGLEPRRSRATTGVGIESYLKISQVGEHGPYERFKDTVVVRALTPIRLEELLPLLVTLAVAGDVNLGRGVGDVRGFVQD